MLVIGSGPAGRRAAVQSAKLGKSVLVVDRGRRLGGVSVHTGTIPSKTLRETVLNLSGWRERGFYGRGYRVKQDILAVDLISRLQKTLDHEVEVLQHQFMRNLVRSVFAAARFVGPDEVELTNAAGEVSQCALRQCADRGGDAAAPAGERALRPDPGVRQRRDPRDRASAADADGDRRRGDRGRVCDDLLGARRAGDADREPGEHPRLRRPRDRRRFRAPDARPGDDDPAGLGGEGDRGEAGRGGGDAGGRAGGAVGDRCSTPRGGPAMSEPRAGGGGDRGGRARAAARSIRGPSRPACRTSMPRGT